VYTNLKTVYLNIYTVSVAVRLTSTFTTITGNNAHRYAVNSAITSPLLASGIAKLPSTGVRIAEGRCFSGNNDAVLLSTNATGITVLITWLTRINSTRLNGCFFLPSHPSLNCDTTTLSATSPRSNLFTQPRRRKSLPASSPSVIPCTHSL
jgi:hypothetical protein